MVDAPERIWVGTDGPQPDYEVWELEQSGSTEYVRADLYEQVKRERDALSVHLDMTHAEKITAERLAGARVKPLEWEAIDGGNAFRAPALIFGWIRIETYTLHNWQVQWSVPGICNLLMPNVFKSPDEAKAAAQADYERRILAALAEPAGEAGPEGETYYTKGKDADWVEGLSDKDIAWALTCASQDLNDSDENVSQWMPVTAFLTVARDRIVALTATPPDASAIREAVANESIKKAIAKGLDGFTVDNGSFAAFDRAVDSIHASIRAALARSAE